MSKPVFNCDREWWNSLSEKEQEECLDWAESCGAKREVFLTDKNTDYPDLVCHPHVSLEITDDELLDILDKN
jgi:hypothetical protein